MSHDDVYSCQDNYLANFMSADRQAGDNLK